MSENGRNDNPLVPDSIKEAEKQDSSFSGIQIIGFLINKPDRTPG